MVSTVRLISQGTTNDHQALSEFVDRGCAYVRTNEPGALAYECFADEASGRVLWHETYEDVDAFLLHVQNLMETGMLEDLMKVYDIERISVLSRVTDPRMKEVVQQFGAVELHGLGGVVR
jgi:quinol monooxygenase YgiN